MPVRIDNCLDGYCENSSWHKKYIDDSGELKGVYIIPPTTSKEIKEKEQDLDKRERFSYKDY